MKVSLDFSPGAHGHFLELVINRYILGVPFNGTAIFQSSGAVHPINVDSEYQRNKIVHCGHFSSFQHRYVPRTEKIVFIKHDSMLDFVLLTNIYYRCHPDAVSVLDFNPDEIIKLHKSFLNADTELALRNNWFAKLSERHFSQAEMIPSTSLPVYNFDYRCFFSLVDFCQELKNVSRFLNETFKFENSLGVLWQNFIEKNQGWRLYNFGNCLISATLQGRDMEIPNDWKLHAFINFKLSKIFDLYDGVLFEQDSYPNTTLKLLSVINEHVKNFDSRW